MKDFMLGKKTEEYRPKINTEDVDQEIVTEPKKKSRKEIKIRKKRNKKKGKRRRNRNYLLWIFLILIIIAAVVVFLSSDFFNVKKITVEGVTKYQPEDIVELSKMKMGDNIFAIENSKGTKKVEELPYVKSTSVKRQLPDEIIFQVEERQPQAAVFFEKEYYVVDEEKVVVDTFDSVETIPIIENIKVKKSEEGQELNIENSKLLEKNLEIIVEGKSANINFYSVGINAKNDENVEAASSVLYITPTLICRGKVEEVLAVIKGGYFEEMLATLEQRNITRGTITVYGDDKCVFSPEIK